MVLKTWSVASIICSIEPGSRSFEKRVRPLANGNPGNTGSSGRENPKNHPKSMKQPGTETGLGLGRSSHQQQPANREYLELQRVCLWLPQHKTPIAAHWSSNAEGGGSGSRGYAPAWHRGWWLRFRVLNCFSSWSGSSDTGLRHFNPEPER